MKTGLQDYVALPRPSKGLHFLFVDINHPTAEANCPNQIKAGASLAQNPSTAIWREGVLMVLGNTHQHKCSVLTVSIAMEHYVHFLCIYVWSKNVLFAMLLCCSHSKNHGKRKED